MSSRAKGRKFMQVLVVTSINDCLAKIPAAPINCNHFINVMRVPALAN